MQRLTPYALLFITAIILERVAISSTQIGFGQSLRSLLIVLLLSTLALLILWSITRDWYRANFMVFMIWAILVLYRFIYRLLKIEQPQKADAFAFVLLIVLSLIYLLIVSKRVWWTIHNPARLSLYFTLVFGLLLSFQLIRLAGDMQKLVMAKTHMGTTAISDMTEKIDLQGEIRPDIYVIILDGYARQDVLDTMYQYDNSEFISQLEDLGFYVADQSHSNYVQTAYSMASLWNFDYVQPWNALYDYTQYLMKPIQNNRTFRLLKEMGYTTVSFESEVDYTEIKESDKYLSVFLPFNKFESLLLVDSPLEPFNNVFKLGIPIPSYSTHILRTQYDLETLKELPTSIPGPKIVYAHIVTPHPPFMFDQNGNALQQQKPYSLWDNTAFTGGQSEYRNGYVNQIIFINRGILDVVSNILAKSETPPIILIMGDHGPASMFTWKLDNPGCVWERTSNFYAMLLPGHPDDGILYPSMTPVNSFRLIFNTYFSGDLPLLDDRTYMMSWQQPTLKIDVTEQRDSRQGCTNND